MGRVHALRMVAWGFGIMGAVVLLISLYVYDVIGNPGAAGSSGLLGLLLVSQAVRVRWIARRLERQAEAA